MNPRLLIDSIVQQTTVLIAQLSTAAGLRSPLAHVADQVFLTLAQEIEAQGVGRKVVADMFGLALRTYQRKVQRLEESRSSTGMTLWEAVLAHVTARGPIHRSAIIERFRKDDELAVTAVLADLVASGWIYSSGRGETAVHGVTSDADRKVLSGDDGNEALAILLWGAIFRVPGISANEVLRVTRVDESEGKAALKLLLSDGRISRSIESDDAPLTSSTFVIPPGAPNGWEAAVFDHFQAVATAITAKLQRRSLGAGHEDSIGGTTLHFGICAGHPFERRVLNILSDVRKQLNELWNEVAGYNREHPILEDAATRVTFYFGQNVRGAVGDVRGQPGDGEAGK